MTASFLTWLGGGDRTLLQAVPSERRRFAQQAVVLLGTACIAAAAMFFALREITGLQPVPAILIAIAWGGFTLSIDRLIGISAAVSRDRRRLFLLGLTRVLLAALVTAVITEPVALTVFASEVATQAHATHSGPGFLAQVRALSQLGQRNAIVTWSVPVTAALYFTISILPSAITFLSRIGPPSLYERVAQAEEDIVANRTELRRVTARRDAEREAQKQAAVDEHMRQLEADLGKKANVHAAAHIEAILDVALVEWSTQVQAKLGVALPGNADGATPTGKPPHQRAISRYTLPEDDDSDLL